MFEWFQRLDSQRPNFRVCVYGHYFPASERKLLRKLRDSLQAGGAFPQTYLVEDLRDEPRFSSDNFLKSIFAIENSHANLIVLTFEGMSQGVLRELDYIIRNDAFVPRSTVFLETDYSANGTIIRKAATSLLDDDLKTLNFRLIHFAKGDFEELSRLAKGTVTNLYYYYAKNKSSELNKTRLY